MQPAIDNDDAVDMLVTYFSTQNYGNAYQLFGLGLYSWGSVMWRHPLEGGCRTAQHRQRRRERASGAYQQRRRSTIRTSPDACQHRALIGQRSSQSARASHRALMSDKAADSLQQSAGLHFFSVGRVAFCPSQSLLPGDAKDATPHRSRDLQFCPFRHDAPRSRRVRPLDEISLCATECECPCFDNSGWR